MCLSSGVLSTMMGFSAPSRDGPWATGDINGGVVHSLSVSTVRLSVSSVVADRAANVGAKCAPQIRRSPLSCSLGTLCLPHPTSLSVGFY